MKMNEMILFAPLICLISTCLADTNLTLDLTCTNTPNDRKVDCFPEGIPSENACTSKGCCWLPTELKSKEPSCFYRRQEPVCANILDEEKFDCYPRGIANEILCHKQGCCWEKKQDGSKEPACFYPRNFRSYNVSKSDLSPSNRRYILQAIQPYDDRYPKTIERARVEINSETKYRLRITITDDRNSRFKPPYPKVPVVDKYSEDTDYEVIVQEDPFGFAVVRKSSKIVIFDTRGVGGLVLSDQFLQISALLPTKYLYGLGERRNNFRINTWWEYITLFNHDALPEDNINLYGSHPFYLAVEHGSSHGVFLLNSNAMDIIIQPAPAITYRTIGGNLDFYFFLGPTPADVISQYLEVIGNPIFPPYWSFGFQISRWGWQTLKHTEEAYKRTRKAQIPLDAVWNDIDYMDGYNDFTINTATFKGLGQFVDKLHEDGLKYVVILDPGVAYNLPRGQYPPYDEAIKQNLLITNSSGLPSVGEVWNKPLGTVFPDFSNPKTGVYWCKLIKELHNNISFDGLWLDMNEISNFKDGSAHGCPANNSLDNPPYTPGVRGGRLNYKTLCMSDKHAIGFHYDVHNIFALFQCIATNQCLEDLTKKRPFVLSRSTFAGSGHYAAHWTGDVYSTWDSMKHSVADILNFNLFGIPMVGADICGYMGNATVELCQRWNQLGAFYPFSRSHNAIQAKDQDPASMGSEELINSTRKAVSNKYRYLPYLYTLFWRAHKFGETVIRPLFFDFPPDQNTLRIDTQFMWGPSILIIPVLREGATSVNAFFPKAIWYNLDDPANKIDSIGEYRQIPAPMDTIPFFLRAGSIIPWQEVKSTTFASRQTNFGLDVALDQKGQANGTLFWDDGETFAFRDVDQHNLLEFNCTDSMLTSNATHWDYKVAMKLSTVRIWGLSRTIPPTQMTVNGKNITGFSYDTIKQMLSITGLEHFDDLSSPLKIFWTYESQTSQVLN